MKCPHRMNYIDFPDCHPKDGVLFWQMDLTINTMKVFKTTYVDFKHNR